MRVQGPISNKAQVRIHTETEPNQNTVNNTILTVRHLRKDSSSHRKVQQSREGGGGGAGKRQDIKGVDGGRDQGGNDSGRSQTDPEEGAMVEVWLMTPRRRLMEMQPMVVVRRLSFLILFLSQFDSILMFNNAYFIIYILAVVSRLVSRKNRKTFTGGLLIV